MSAAGGGKDAAQAVEGAWMVDNEGGGHACKSRPFFGGGWAGSRGSLTEGQCSHWRSLNMLSGMRVKRKGDTKQRGEQPHPTLTLLIWRTSGSESVG